MSDARLRELERRWKESGSSADEGIYLRERARAGDLDSRRLELAVYCGYPPLGGPEEPPRSFGDWIANMPFPGRGRHGLAREWPRVPLAAARALLPIAAALGPSQIISDALLEAERDFVGFDVEPRPALRALVNFMQQRHGDGWEPTPPDVAVAWFARGAGRAHEFEAWARKALYPEGVWSYEPGVSDAVESAFPEAEGRLWLLRLAIRDEIVPWALGYRDPVRERVEAAEEAPGS